MTSEQNDNFDTFIDVLTDEVMAMPDDQVLEGLDPEQVKANGLRILLAAKAEAGRRRLAAAKAGITAVQEPRSPENYLSVTIDEARRYLAQVANDEKYTRAARNLGELSDDEVMRLYSQFKQLESEGDTDEGPQ